MSTFQVDGQAPVHEDVKTRPDFENYFSVDFREFIDFIPCPGKRMLSFHFRIKSLSRR